MKEVYYFGSFPWKYYYTSIFNDVIEVSEEEFFNLVGYDRKLVPMKYDKDNINRQIFYIDDVILGYRER